MNKLTLTLLLFFVSTVVGAAMSVSEALTQPIPFLSLDNEPIQGALQSLGRAHGLSIVADPDVTGDVSVEMNNTTVRGVLDALLRSNGYFYEEQDGWIAVQRFKTVLYTFDYPQLTRSGSSTSSISLGAQNSNNSSSQNGGLSVSGSGAVGLSNALNGVNGSGNPNSNSNSDSTQIQISQKNDSDFWQSIETQVRGMLGKDETLILNRFSGIAQVKAGLRTQREIAAFVDLVNNRVGAQVEIVAKVVEVRLNNLKKLGIDWNVAAFTIGKNLRVGSPVVPPGGTNPLNGLVGDTNVTQAGEFQFSPDTFSGTIGAGKVDVVIRALEEQGNVRVTNQPRLRLLNNQSGYIKDAIDRPFFKLSSQVTINAGGVTTAGTQPITQTQYQTQTISIGTVLPVTAQISDDGMVTLDVTPALTRLREVVASPDKLQTAPVLEVKQTSTIVRVRSGETAVIGGLITDSDADTQRKVPGLGDVPVIGRAFRSEGKVSQRTELVILLTPTVIRSTATHLPTASATAQTNASPSLAALR
jgi:type II secretory pathway component GspD/PulD (secretin)